MMAGCSGQQSALDPAGEEAETIAHLFWVMVFGGAIVWCLVLTLALHAARSSRKVLDAKVSARLILWGGAIFPAVVLIALLSYALWLMPSLRPIRSISQESALTVHVDGRQFWWEVVYRLPDGREIRSANEVVIPVGERVEFNLTSPDVIHSFWIPSLGGKMDMIPGRTNRLSLRAVKPGTYRGVCAEFCGTSHALMAFTAIAMEPPDFNRWIEDQIVPAAAVNEAGSELFARHGCGACHVVNGTSATTTVGPDLSHVGTRRTIAAGTLPNDEENLVEFITRSDTIKPGSRMPSYEMVPEDDIRLIAGWLRALK